MEINKHFFYLGETKKASERAEKYLSLIIDTKGTWREHFRQKIKHANSALGAIQGAGLLGGSQPAHKALNVAKATVWTIFDSGRLATNYLSESNRTRRKEIQKLKLKVAKVVLNLSKYASSIGVLAERGWIATSMP